MDDNGREACWEEMGGAVVDWVHPLDENEWFGDNDAFGVLMISEFGHMGGWPYQG